MSRSTQAAVTVVIPCHASSRTITAAIESVAGQILTPHEVIAVDDASPDDTLKRLEAIADRHWPFTFRIAAIPHNVGPGAARNAGWSLASTDSRYVAFLDADDRWHPCKVATQATWLDGHAEFAWCAHRCGVMSTDRPAPTVRCPDPAYRCLSPRGLLLRNTVATPSVMVRRNVPVRFRNDWLRCEDLMLWLDWLDYGLRGAMLESFLAELGRRPGTPGGLTGDRRAMYYAECRIFDTLFHEASITAFEHACWRSYARARLLWRMRGL